MKGIHTGPEILPARSLGPAVILWAEKYLLQPDGPQAGERWHYTEEQMRFVMQWYAVDERGRFIYRTGMLRRMKGWGKDPLGATLCCVEFVGPCRFGGWDRDGYPIAIPHSAAWVMTAAVSKDQTRNTTTLLPGMLSPQAIERYRIELGKEIAHANGGKSRLEAVTSSPKALEGPRPTFTLKNETHLWFKSNEGHAMSAVIARNAAKSRDGSSRVLAISNAHVPGEDSDAEHDWDAWQKIESGRSRATGVLYDALEAPPDVELVARGTGEDGEVTEEDRERARESLIQGLIAARGDSEWVNPERLMEEIYDPRTPPSVSRRFYLNQIVAAEDAWLSNQEWDACAAPVQVEPGEQITLGFDGSKSRDTTVLVGCRVSDSHLFRLGYWEPEALADKVVPTADVDAAVKRAFETYDVVGFYADVNEWESYTDKWEQDHGELLCARATQLHPVKWDMRRAKEAAMSAQAYHDAIVEREITHANDPVMNQHHYNARRRPTAMEGVVSFSKETAMSERKVDFVAGCMLARQARQDYMVLPENRKRTPDGPSIYETRGLITL